jgi:hypothetical protein
VPAQAQLGWGGVRQFCTRVQNSKIASAGKVADLS